MLELGSRSTIVFVACAVVVATTSVHAGHATPFQHKWDTVKDLMGVHGALSEAPSSADIEFVAKTYPMVTYTGSCKVAHNANQTIEDSILQLTSNTKAINPDMKIGMYWRSDFVMEIVQCSSYALEWERHPEWRLKYDNGTLVQTANSAGFYYIDYTQAGAREFFARVLVNVSIAKLPSGKPILDFVYIDGDPNDSQIEQFKAGISHVRSAALVKGYYDAFADIQNQLNAFGFEQKVILNGMDGADDAKRHVATGCAGSMFDHWSILQFVDSSNGDFNIPAMVEGIDMLNSSVLSNVTTHVKGWPGPIVHQKDVYPPNIQPQPTSVAAKQQIAADRFNSELALFLLTATTNNYWIYSWFWDLNDYVPNNPMSTVPPAFFPQANCPLGEPQGPPMRVDNTWTYQRRFEHASVFVDLNNRTNSRVDFTNC